MADLCPGSASLVTPSPDDLVYLTQRNRKAPLSFPAVITLSSRTSYNHATQHIATFINPLFSTTSLSNSPALCSTCSFCTLLLHSIEKVFASTEWSWQPYFQHLTADVKELVVHISLSKLSYLKDSSPWAEGSESVSTNALHAISLSGYTWLSSVEEGRDAWLRNGVPQRMEFEIRFETFAREGEKLGELLGVHQRPVGERLLDPGEAGIEKVKTWIKECDEAHEGCWGDLKAESGARGFMPKRLVFVGGSEPDGLSPRLVVTDSLTSRRSIYDKQDRRYIALSYCWGVPSTANPLLRTTSVTLSERMAYIALASMPLAFRDAVTVARALSISYLWIDSLCIVQDSAEDWQIESSRMADIFSNAYLTIAVASGDSAHHSFLQRGPTPTCYVPVTWKEKKIENASLGLRSRRAWGTDKMAEIFDSRWVTRGWTFQEERLARRILIFGKTKFFLDCRTLERAEDTEKYRLRPDWVDSVSGSTATPASGGREGRVSKYNQTRSVVEHWQTLCSHYMYRELSFPADKLPAISGIANKFAEKVQCAYLAGMWRNHLDHDLLWYTPGPAQRPEQYRAPSWSWASLDGKVLWPRWRSCKVGNCHMYSHIVDAGTTAGGLDPFGIVSSGYIMVSGAAVIVDAWPVLERSTAVFNPKDAMKDFWRLLVDGVEVAQAQPDVALLAECQTKRYTALLLSKCQPTKNHKTKPRGLLLECIGEQQANEVKVYTRIGVFEIPEYLEETLPLWVDVAHASIVIV